MRSIHDKGDDRTAPSGWSEYPHAGQLGEMFHRIGSKSRIVLENGRASDSLDVINGCRESDGTGNVRRAGFKSVRRFLERAFFQRNADDHLSAAVPRRHRIENLGAPRSEEHTSELQS